MRIIILLIICIFFLLPKPSLSDWNYIGTFGDGDYYIDSETAKYEGAIVTFWWKVKNAESKKVKTTINCENKLWTIKDAFIYKPDGSLGAAVHIIERNLEWVEIAPNSAAERWYELLCKERGYP